MLHLVGTMKKKVDTSKFVRSTKEGRLYIKTEDFFKSEEVRDLVVKLKKSSIYEEIERNKKELKPA